MIDFLEYVVAELKSRRLSKTDAAALVRQFSRRSSRSETSSALHPLLHRNTSDLTEQRYASTFTGDELFLADHQVRADGSAAQRVLPGVAYLEMARASVERAMGALPDATFLELLNVVWAQPIVVAGKKDVSIALLPDDGDAVDFEIYCEAAGEDVVHCQGRAVATSEATPAAVDLEELQARMVRGRLAPEKIYATSAAMGLVYGPSFQSVTAIHRGDRELLAHLRLPAGASTLGDFVLHPSLMDGALQAAIGLVEGAAESAQPLMPFALERLRVLAPCTGDMVAWLRYSPGSEATNKVLKLDLDLFDDRGNPCVQMRGFSWRVWSIRAGAAATDDNRVDSLLAAPVWQARALDSGARRREVVEHHAFICDRSDAYVASVASLTSHGRCVALRGGQHADVASRYTDCAVGSFERIRAILQAKPRGTAVVQIVVIDDEEQALLAGLSGLIRTAALETPHFVGQLLLVPPDMTPEELARQLEREKSFGVDPLVRFERGVRHVLRWQEIAPEGRPVPVAFKDGGVYLITGGLGGLGVVFAREILERTRESRVVLTGRSPNDAAREALLDGLCADRARVSYREADVTDRTAVDELVASIQRDYRTLDGVLHAAGTIADGFIVRKNGGQFRDVLAPKVAGTYYLDQATAALELDFFVLFAAVAGAMGNLGQADYAAANAFMDHFVVYRNRQVAANRRHGVTRAIDWPLWQAGGMGIDAASVERLRQTTGMHPMQTATGLLAFHRAMTLQHDRILVMEGDLARVRKSLLSAAEPEAEPETVPPVAETIDAGTLAERTQHYLRRELSELLKVPARKIDARAALENYGIDSILAMKLTNQLEQTFGSLPKTLFFEYQTIRELAEYFVANHATQLAAMVTPLTPVSPRPGEALPPPLPPTAAVEKAPSTRRAGRRRRAASAERVEDDPIAIIGLSGRYPQAIDVEMYWENLRQGKDCITEVPRERWDWREYFSADRTMSGYHYSKWGGFIEGVDEFDALFFNISPVEAEQIDPQERLFLQHAWSAVEDAGYTRASLQMPFENDLPGQVGVYVGVMYTEYQLFGAEAIARGRRHGVPGSASSIANRVSYALNLHGPSMTLDTMCSSSLTAIHVACQDLKQKRTSMAIAGGVNVSIHPNKYLVLSDGQFISSDGNCQSFGEGGDGYIPGEGVGAVVLKRLSDAKRDGDHIYAIIRGSALTHGGKTNGYSVPNPHAQTSAIARALAESRVDARHVSYIEAHGTGTKLGDPIEIAALTKAFHRYTEDTGFCLIGSAKSNVGHCESAAGIAGLTKVLLQMRHRQIVSSLHSTTLNPHIDFEKTPFVVNQALRPWEPPVIDGRTLPRIAGISSFGAGGSNAHMIVEEYEEPSAPPVALAEVPIVLSARTSAQLRQRVCDLVAFLRPRIGTIDVVSVAYTLQVGRESMEERLGFVVRSGDELLRKLEAWLEGDPSADDVRHGKVRRNDETLSLFTSDVHLQEAIGKWIAGAKLAELLDLWVKGLDLDWSALYRGGRPRRVSLPTYPFARDRYWTDAARAGGPPAVAAATTVLHPLLHSNTSDLSEQRYHSAFTGRELFLEDHQVSVRGGAPQKVLPGVAYLEMARAAIEKASPSHAESSTLELRDVVWAQPIVVTDKRDVSIVLSPDDGGRIAFEIHTFDGDDEIVHCQGYAVTGDRPEAAALDLAELRGRMLQGRVSADSVYGACTRLGLLYGPSFRAIAGIDRGSGELLAELRLPASATEGSADYVLHPALLDASLQAAVGLVDVGAESDPPLPFALETLRIVSPPGDEAIAWVRHAAAGDATGDVVTLDIDLCDQQGNVCVEMRALSSRRVSGGLEAASRVSATATVMATPVWRASAGTTADATGYAERHVVLCDLAETAESVASNIPPGNLVSLRSGAQTTIAERFIDSAVACFERIRSILQVSRRGKTLVQVVVAGGDEHAPLIGLSALLRTAALENPRLAGQLVIVPADTPGDELGAMLESEQARAHDPVVRYQHGRREVLGWQEVALEPDQPPIAFRDDGVYLITGGLGGIGTLFAQAILEQARNAAVVLTGRSPAEVARARMERIPANGRRLAYQQVDLLDAADVGRMIALIRNEYGRLDGILHCAGTLADAYILNKGSDRFREVLAPKVTGTYHLDHASRSVELDFFVLFSSLAGVAGNPGQADYACANAFMDHFAAHRNRLVASNQRYGRTCSINWPLWEAGGMTIDPASREALQSGVGMQPMRTATGIEAFHRSLALACDQVLVAAGDPERMRRVLFDAPAAIAPQTPRQVEPAAADRDSLSERTQEYLRKQLASVLKLPSHKVDAHAALEEYGIDSVLALKLTNQLEKAFGPLSKTLFFEYRTIRDLAAYFTVEHAAQLSELLAPTAAGDVGAPPVQQAAVSGPKKRSFALRFRRPRSVAAVEVDPIAIIGLSGRYPQALDIDAYWENLRDGKDCITEIPKERWDWREYFTEDRGSTGHHYSKWGGFIEGVDEFDPLFFNISPIDAELIDPQERLFLQHAWMAVEDAGYTRAALQAPAEHDLPGQVGVYVGVMYSEYQMFGAEAGARGRRLPIPGSTASVANRVSYALDLHGPSVTLDTMCSSSLTAIHFACQDLKLGRTSMAIAGGVNVSIHPNKYLVLSAGQFISSDGHCQSFGEGGDGYIPGEGVGAVVLKRLSDAVRDGDHIYGVIRGSAVNHGGKTNGYTVPNPQAQGSVIARALADAGTDARHISYIEAHGTGTTLGDPIEIAALSKAFHSYTEDTGFCLIGSAKSNIGHCESAAGIAGLTKVLLQMRHRHIVPSLHSARLNPHIDFSRTPFVVNQTLRAWEPPVIDGRAVPRIAGVSSFGAGGANAHLLVGEYHPPLRQAPAFESVAVLLSARTAEQLRQKASDLLEFLRRPNAVDLTAVAYTLQVGREAMEERLGFVVSSAEELTDKLTAWIAGEPMIEDAYQGEVRRETGVLSVFGTDADLRDTVDRWIVARKLPKLLELWVKGLNVDWSRLYGSTTPQRVSLPVYPFARERYWIDPSVAGSTPAQRAATAALHPVLHSNVSDLSEQRYRSTFTGEEFFLADHQVKRRGGPGGKVLPAVVYLEMARAAIENAAPERTRSAVLELRNVVWAHPIVVAQPRQIQIAVSATEEEQIEYEIYSDDSGDEIVHCQGIGVLSRAAAPAGLDVEAIQKRMNRAALEPGSLYEALCGMGLVHGPSLRGIERIRRGAGEVLAHIVLPGAVEGTARQYGLHPTILDGALQAAAGLVDDLVRLADEPQLPFALESLRILAPCPTTTLAWVRYAPGTQAGDAVVKVDIDLCDERGNVFVQMRGISSRAATMDVGAVESAPVMGELLATPSWHEAAVQGDGRDYTEHHVILCEMAVDIAELESALPGAHCLSIRREHDTIARRYCQSAVACFERIQSILRRKPEGTVLMQIVVPDGEEQQLLAGLSGLLKTAMLETPHFVGQLVMTGAGATAAELGVQLLADKRGGADALVHYDHGTRRVLRWQEVGSDAGPADLAFREDGVYLITGGLGGLGLLFAKEILEQTRETRVVLAGRSEWSVDRQRVLDGLSHPGRVAYRRMDLDDAEQVREVVASIRGEYRRLDGVLHSAGMIADGFLVKKRPEDFQAVLAPKVTGTYHLDQATQDVELDFFVLFSSIAGAVGNVGQADYATANGFMDQFAAHRNRLVQTSRRHGRTRSINWPLWQAGGMSIDTASQELLRRTTGMQPMRTATGMRAFHRALALSCDQIVVAEGDIARMREVFLADVPPPAERQTAGAVVAGPSASAGLAEKTQEYLRRELSEAVKLPLHKIDSHAALEKYGIDSILAMRLTNKLEKTFGSLSKTLFYEYQTIAALSGYFVKAHPEVLRSKLGLLEEAPRPAEIARPPVAAAELGAGRRKKRRLVTPGRIAPMDIAIVGLAGRYPQADDLGEFWRNLRSGRDCITEIPPERWDHDRYYDPDPNKVGRSYSKWGGFISGVDRFDPLFFNISPREAALLDPQERLFLETAWETIEDAGYSKESISGGRVGVFVGVMWGHYELFGVESLQRGEHSLPGSSYASIANRVSYFFDFHGPSIALDTMCSSSLTSIHLACEDLRRGEIDAAIAGGVNVTIHPYKYLGLSQGKFAASDGRCRSFGAGGDGYVPGEGVGAVLLKPLESALRDGDHLYAVIKGSSVNHGGKTNGYTVPNPIAQGDLIRDALRKSGIDPATIGYVETHGTGTSLGDPIEITGLERAFDGLGAEKQFCPIGSVKSNIGHLESAAGIASVTKAILQIRHGELVPSIHAHPLNPNIDFTRSPFYVQTELAEWKRPETHPRRIGVSSFGAGGSNAHLILEEYAGASDDAGAPDSATREIFVLSARTPDVLRRYADRMLRFLDDAADLSLASIACTSQVGRTPMDVRLAIIASSVEELRDGLRKAVALLADDDDTAVRGAEPERVFYGSARDSRHGVGGLVAGTAGKAFLQSLLAGRELERVARLWVLGADVDWSHLQRHVRPRRVSLPTYPFARERCWIDRETPPLRLVSDRATETAGVLSVERPEEHRRLCYYPQWAPLSLPEHDATHVALGPVLIFDASPQLFAAMKQQRPDDVIVLVQPGPAFQSIEPNVYAVDLEREEQLRELMGQLRERGQLPGVVVHHLAAECDLEVREQVVRQLDRGLHALLGLSKSVIRENHPIPLRIVSLFSIPSEATPPLAAALGGFLKTVTLEHPTVLAKVIEIQAHDDDALSEKAALLWDELYEPSWTAQEVRHHRQGGGDETRYERYVRRLALSPGPEGTPGPLPLGPRGVYLITGGLGGLGLIIAEDLAKKFQARLILVGRSAPNAVQQRTLEGLRARGAEVLVLQADVSRLEEMEMVVREAKARFSAINGVIHAAGINRGATILRKTRQEVEDVLAPKIHGTINLDLATRGERLDFFVLFSSVAGVTGNHGQCDYAYANHFLDAFAETREHLRKEEKRWGRTLSISWPFWVDGGMTMPASDVVRLEQETGMCPLPTSDGIHYWEHFLRSEELHGVALYGIASRIAASFDRTAVVPRQVPRRPEAAVAPAILARTEEYLKGIIGDELHLAPERIDSGDRLESLGIDSVAIHRINARLERDLGALPKTLLYEHESVREVAQFFLRERPDGLLALLGDDASAGEPPVEPPVVDRGVIRVEVEAAAGPGPDEEEAIAIIGVHGAYPQSATPDEYWENLREGRDLTGLVPPERWNCEELFDPDPAAASEGKIYCKWGGFLADYDKFDPHFFKISTAEATVLDPQERLFLESVWAAIEDAAYTRDRLRACFPKGNSANVGVFVGVTTNSYDLWAPEERTRGNHLSPIAMPWSIANRVSYFFDFNGPSLPVDTACSSSLVAVHLACESLRKRECQLAIAGGVNLYLHPSKYHSLCQRGMLSRDGKCHSYGAGDDGFVPGEGVGCVVLKPLSRAVADRDRIYAVIRASAYGHSGRSNGYSAPNPNAQASLIGQTLRKAGIHPETIGYVEGHGTGTQLGDSIEIAALTKAFRGETAKTQFCPIGCVKANVGHSESAAGIAGLAKVLLQMQHGQLAPTIHAGEPNPNIDFDDSPFYLQHRLADWPAPPDHPRRALINSFGAGGVNACIVVEQYPDAPAAPSSDDAGPYLFILSARSEERLLDYADRLLARLRKEPDTDLASLCYTMQVGREAMAERLATVVSDVPELIERLENWSRQGSATALYRGSSAPRRGSRRSLRIIPDGGGEDSLFELASRWVAGEDVAWERLHAGIEPRLVSLPNYPFARERYWITDSPVSQRPSLSTAPIHPLIAYNSSTLNEVRFSSSLPVDAFYAVDHTVAEERIFPGAGFLEMACMAANMASEQHVRRLTDVAWVRPLSFRTGDQSVRTVLRRIGDSVEYMISSLDEENEAVVHSEGRVPLGSVWGAPAETERPMPPRELKALCGPPEEGAAYYDRFTALGLRYGPSFQTIRELYVNHVFVLAKLQIAEHLQAGFGQFILHPSMIDGALQTIAGLMGRDAAPTPYVPFALDEIEILGAVPQTCYAHAEPADASVRHPTGVTKFNIRLVNEKGDVLVRLKNLYVRPLVKPLANRHATVVSRAAAGGRVLSLTGGEYSDDQAHGTGIV